MSYHSPKHPVHGSDARKKLVRLIILASVAVLALRFRGHNPPVGDATFAASVLVIMERTFS